MKQKSHNVSDSDDSESIDDPSPVPLVESTRIEKSAKKGNSSNNESDREHEEVTNSKLNSSKSSPNLDNGKKKSTELSQNTSSDKDEVELQATFSLEDLSSDDEAYIFQCAKDFKKEDLLDKFINFSKSKQFVYTKNGEKYELEIVNSENQTITLAVPKTSSEGVLVNLPLKGHMIIKKPLEIQTSLANYFKEVEDTVPFPDDLKTRHPFLGVNWKSHIDEAKESIEKSHSIRKMKKKKKKRKREELEDDVKVKEENVSEDYSPKKKRKKCD